jgi:hypothetical protein
MIDVDTVPPADDLPPEDGWQDEEPIPLTVKVPLPKFPVDALPGPIAAMVRQTSQATQTDPAMAGTSALSSLSACTGGHAEIEIRAGWREPLNLYNATIASPGERKSAVQRAMTRPLLDVETKLAESGDIKRFEAQADKELALKAAEKQRNIAASTMSDPDKRDEADQARSDAIAAMMTANAIEVPAIPRLVADDITPEAAASILAEQGGRLAIISAEGGIFDIIAGRYSRLPNLDLWLKGHSGDQLKVDRKNRAPECIPRPALTLGLMIQPAVLGAIAANREFRGRGLLARFLYAYPVPMVGHRNIEPPEPDQQVVDAYANTVSALAAGMVEWVSDPAVLTLTDEARKTLTAIAAVVEPTLAGDGELAPLADWGAKYVGAVARIAGILHLATYGEAGAHGKAVEAATVEAAYRIGTYFKVCAINAFSEMGSDQVTADAGYLWERIEHLGQDEVSERDMHAACRSRFPTKADLRPALARLVDHGYLMPLPRPEPTGGRPASPRYKVYRTKGTQDTEGRQ